MPYDNPEPDLTDVYPSRGGRKSELQKRKDPVTYHSATDDMPITPEQLAHYTNEGYLVLKDFFSEEEVGAFEEESERLRNKEDDQLSDYVITEPGSRDVRSVFMIHENSPVFRRLAWDKRLAGLASFLLGDEVYIHQSRLNYKPGFRGKEFYWHSDFETWHVEDGMPRMRALSISLTLTENYEYNGPLMVIPGSHKVYATCEGYDVV